jgi:hypothetical protein
LASHERSHVAGFDLTGTIFFMNVDLDVFSRTSLDPLATAFGEVVRVLYVGGEGRSFEAHFEIADSFEKDADTLMLEFVALVRGLPPSVRKVWNGATSRDFNVGIQSAIQPRAHELRLQADTLEAVARVGGSILITTYPPVPDMSPRRTTPVRKRR